MCQRLFVFRRTAGQAEIHDDRILPLVDHHVGRFEIPVDDLVLMRLFQSQSEFPNHSNELIDALDF